jgi:hypothetical protein
MFFVIVALIVIAVIVSFIFGSRRGGRGGGGGAASGYYGSFGDHGHNGDGGGWFDRGEAMAVVVATVVGRRQLAARSLLTGPALKDSQKYRPPANRAFVYERIAKAKS